MLDENLVSRATKIAEVCLGKVRTALAQIENDHDTGLVNDPEGHERMEREARRLRGIFYSLQGVAENPDYLNKMYSDAYLDTMAAEDRVRECDPDHYKFPELMTEARVRSNVFHALTAVKLNNYNKLLDEINLSFLN